MPHVIRCRCGANTKQFKINVGDFYIEECCTEAGYDHLGNATKLSEGCSADLSELEQAQVEETAAAVALVMPLAESMSQKPSSPSFLKKLIGLKPGRGKLRDMNRGDLVKMAQDKGIEVKEGVTKNELIALILG